MANGPSKGKKLERDSSNGRFVKGNKSGGRKKIPDDIKKMFEEASPYAVRLLIEVMQNPEADPNLRVKAATHILDRHLGKPVQGVQVDATSIPQVVFTGVVPE